MRILIACEDFRVGGAQVFALRLANALTQEHEVLLYSHYANYIDSGLTQHIAPHISILCARLRLDWFIRKLDRLLFKLSIDFSVREKLIIHHIRKVATDNDVELVHSHMFKSDYVVAKAIRGLNVPLVVTMHGNYEGFLKKYLARTGEVILNYPHKLRETLTETDAIAYLTEKNLRVFKEEEIVPAKCHQHIIKNKIYNGFIGRIDQPHCRNELGIEKKDLVFGLVARGIPEKGWEVAIEAFIALVPSTTQLVLVGWSEYVAELAQKYKENKRIHFVGHSDNPLNWIQMFDVGLLPSVYGESLPNVIVEYLYCGKPVITSDVGESPLMIDHKGKKAGFVLSVKKQNIVAEELRNCMNRYVDNEELLERQGTTARLAFKEFTMDKCIRKYAALYEDVLGKQ